MSLFSLFTDDSPMSDLKMDISGSCSSDSPAATSPEAVLGKGVPLSYLCKYPDELRILKSSSDLENLNEEDSESIETTVNHSLDNRRANSQSSQLISVHSHPLMSPDISPVFHGDELKVVAPQSPLRLAKSQPVSNRSSPKRHDRLDMLDKDNGSAVSISSDSEADQSQYQANVGPSFQCVSLVSKQNTSVGKRDPGRSNSCSNIEVEALSASARPRQSSIESLSVRSFDELDGISNFLSRCSSTSLIEEVHLGSGSGEQTANGRNSHKVVLPDGTTREIDMKVIEPYKRVLSHGGYLKDDCQNAIVVFSSCFLPDRSRADYRYVMDSLFLYVEFNLLCTILLITYPLQICPGDTGTTRNGRLCAIVPAWWFLQGERAILSLAEKVR